MRKIQLSIGLQPDQYEDLKYQATVEDVSIAHIVRCIIKEALAKNEEAKVAHT